MLSTFQSSAGSINPDVQSRVWLSELVVQCTSQDLQSHSKCCDVSQVKRVVERDGCSLELAQSKVAAQMPLAVKQKKSQYIIDNSGTRQETEGQV